MRTKLFGVPENKSLQVTIQKMYELENYSLNDFDFINFCRKIFQPIFLKKNNDLEFLKYLHKYIVDNFHYSNDEYDETLISPSVNWFLESGDCDDFALFIKTVLDFFHFKNVKYILFARNKNDFSHIAVLCQLNNKIYLLDGTNNNFNTFNNVYLNYKIIG